MFLPLLVCLGFILYFESCFTCTRQKIKINTILWTGSNTFLAASLQNAFQQSEHQSWTSEHPEHLITFGKSAFYWQTEEQFVSLSEQKICERKNKQNEIHNLANGKITKETQAAADWCDTDTMCVTDPQQPVRVHLPATRCVGELGTSGVSDQTQQRMNWDSAGQSQRGWWRAGEWPGWSSNITQNITPKQAHTCACSQIKLTLRPLRPLYS